MAKRFTDSEKWRDEWYGSLTNDYRIVWQYLLDNCTQAGIFKKDYRLLNFQCNVSLTEKEIFEIFSGRLIDCGKFIFIPKFLKFQYPGGLNSRKPVIVGIRKELESYNLIKIVKQSLGNHYLTVKDKETEEETETAKDKEKLPPSILDQMLTIYTNINSDYPVSKKDDMPALRQISEFIINGKGIENVKPEEIYEVWEITCQGIKRLDFWNGKGLKSIANNFQSVIKDIKNLKNGKNGKPIITSAKAEQYLKENGLI